MTRAALAEKTASWETVELREVLALHYGKALPKTERNPSGAIPVYGANGIKDYADKSLSDEPALIIGRKGSAGQITRVDGPFWPLDVTYYTSHDHDRIDFDYLTYALSALDLPSLARGVKPGINRNDVYALELILPPLDEQKRIVAVLDQAFAALDRVRAQLLKNLDDCSSLLESFVEAELDKSNGQPITLQELLDNGSILSHLDGNHGSDYPRKEEFISSGVPYISANCIVDGQIDLNRAKHLSEKRAAQLRKGIAQDGDVIFAHNASVGPVAILRTSKSKVVLGTSVTYYRCNPGKIDPEFLLHEMRGAQFRRQYEAVMKQATRNQVPITAQRKLTHTIPDIARQRQIAGACSEVANHTRHLAEQYQSSLASIDECRKTLLEKTFSGDLN